MRDPLQQARPEGRQRRGVPRQGGATGGGGGADDGRGGWDMGSGGGSGGWCGGVGVVVVVVDGEAPRARGVGRAEPEAEVGEGAVFVVVCFVDSVGWW